MFHSQHNFHLCCIIFDWMVLIIKGLNTFGMVPIFLIRQNIPKKIIQMKSPDICKSSVCAASVTSLTVNKYITKHAYCS